MRRIPRIRRACLDCNDTDHEFVRVNDARVLLELTDTTGDTERVAVMSVLVRPTVLFVVVGLTVCIASSPAH